MANFNWQPVKERTLDEAFRHYNLSPLKSALTFEQFIKKIFTDYGFRIV
jgi:hypothetical protein